MREDDDHSEVLFKLFEQMRLMNSDIQNHLELQQNNKAEIKTFEQKLLKEEDYLFFLEQVKTQDNVLGELSQKFADITSEAKKILDNIRAKSEDRKQKYGVSDSDAGKSYHKDLPRDLMTDLINTAREVGIRFFSHSFVG